MQYPTVTEQPSTREAVAHDTFIDGLTMEPVAAAPAPPTGAPHHARRRRRALKLAAAVVRI